LAWFFYWFALCALDSKAQAICATYAMGG
jgi:hypothetical protein